jgi:hypothetical protein
VQCQSQGGTASLIGFPEWTNVSRPPVLYLNQDLGGSLTTTTWGQSEYPPYTCVNNLGSCTSALSGGAHYDASTGNLVQNDGYYTSTPTGCGFPDGARPPGQGLPWPLNVGYGCGIVRTVNQTTQNYAGTPEPCEQCYDGWFHPSSGALTNTLSSPDTLDNAMTRAMAGHSWGACNCASCTSFMSQRGPTDTSVSFRKVQVQAGVVSVLGVTFLLSVSIGERAYGTSGPFVDDGTKIYFTVTCTEPTGQMDWSAWGDLPCDEGVEYAIIGCSSQMIS